MHWSIGAKLARRNYGRSVREDRYSTFCCDFGLSLLDGLCNLSKEIGLHCSSFEGDSEMSINTRPVHGSGRFGFGPEPNSTRLNRVDEF